ncbi:MAG: cell division protein FtsQ/DivIB, partial [Cyanobacteria bacterium J06576_12]
LVNVQPEELANSLTAYPPIEAAIVHRRLIPPKLHVQITEKVPVAIALPTNRPPLQSLTDESTPFEEPGLIDAQGYWMPRDSFSELGVEANPLLKVIGIRAKDVATWKQIYRGVAQSPVGVTAIDWSNQDNLILHSELGKVHLGPYSERFTAQISALDQLRSIEEQTPSEQIAFINLQDPENPIIEVLKAADTTTAGSQESL